MELVTGLGVKVTDKEKAIFDLTPNDDAGKVVRMILTTLFNPEELAKMTAQGRRGSKGIPKQLLQAITGNINNI